MDQNMPDRVSGARGRFVVKTESTDAWIIIGRRAVRGVMVWHRQNDDAVDLVLDGERRGIVGGKVPPGAEDLSHRNTGFLRYRWPDARIEATEPPFGQPGVREAIDRATWAFARVAENRVP